MDSGGYTSASKTLMLVWALLFSVPALAASARQPPARGVQLQKALDQLAAEARPGLLGIAVLDMDSGAEIRVNADHAYPMMSVFKAPVAATVLAQIDAGRLSLDQTVTIARKDVEGGSAVPSLGAHFSGAQMTFTVDRLLKAAVSESDNTAADALVRLVGGPKVVTEFLQVHGIEGMRVDLDEAGIARIFAGNDDGTPAPANETEQHASARLQRGYSACLRDPRNRSTPDAAIMFLSKLWKGQLLPPASTRKLLALMYGQTVPTRLRSGLPAHVRFADKCGTSYSLNGETAAFNDMGIMTWPDGHAVIVAAFLTASHADKAHREAIFKNIAKDISATWAP